MLNITEENYHEIITRVRGYLKLNKSEFAGLLNISLTSMVKWEKREATPPLKMLEMALELAILSKVDGYGKLIQQAIEKFHLEVEDENHVVPLGGFTAEIVEATIPEKDRWIFQKIENSPDVQDVVLLHHYKGINAVSSVGAAKSLAKKLIKDKYEKEVES